MKKEDRTIKKEDKILEAIISYKSVKGYSPTVREIGKLVGLKSPSSVYHYLEKLRNDGRIIGGELPRTICICSELPTQTIAQN